MKITNEHPRIVALALIGIFYTATTTNAANQTEVSATVNSDCSFNVKSASPFSELHLNYWTHDYIKLSELPKTRIEESSFSVPLAMSIMYTKVYPAGGDIYFYNAPLSAKKEDFIKLELPASLKGELTDCFETLPCPCNISDISSEDIDIIELNFNDANSESESCGMEVYYNDQTHKKVILGERTEEDVTYYSCEITLNGRPDTEFRYSLNSWDDRCTKDAREFVSSNINLLYGRNKDKTFCQSN